MKLVERLPETNRILREGIDAALHRGVQVYVSLGGRTVVDDALGESSPGVFMTPDTLTLWLSAGKPLTAVAIARLREQDRLDWDDPVSSHLPEFAQSGKERVTIRHLLTHTGGFRNTASGWPHRNWDELIRQICEAPLEPQWTPGARAGYHIASSWFILGELIHRLGGRDFQSYLREEVCLPLGMHDTWNGLPPQRQAEYGDRIGWMFFRDQNRLIPHRWHENPRCAAPSPGGNTRGPARELGRFYEMMLQEGSLDDTRLLTAQSVRELTGRQREGLFDETFQHTVDFGLGFLVDSNRYGADTVPYGFGRYCSPETFGHGGAQSSIGFADPVRRLVVVVITNGMAGEGRHNRRNRAVNEAVYRDLALDR